MISSRRIAFGVIAFALASLVPVTASAYCQTLACRDKCGKDKQGCPTGGAPLHWTKMPIVYRFHSRGSRILVREEARAAIRASFHRWSDVVCPDGRRTSLRFREDEDVDADKPLIVGERAPEAFGIYFRDFGWPHKDVDATLALTTQLFSKNDGTIEYSDLEVNTGAKRFAIGEETEGTDLQSVMTHEVGHYIGLAHSTAPQSIMADRYCDSGDKRCDKGKFAARRLSPDDLEAVCDLYPPGASPTEEPKDALSCKASASPSGAPGAIVAAALASLFGVWVRRRCRS